MNHCFSTMIPALAIAIILQHGCNKRAFNSSIQNSNSAANGTRIVTPGGLVVRVVPEADLFALNSIQTVAGSSTYLVPRELSQEIKRQFLQLLGDQGIAKEASESKADEIVFTELNVSRNESTSTMVNTTATGSRGGQTIPSAPADGTIIGPLPSADPYAPVTTTPVTPLSFGLKVEADLGTMNVSFTFLDTKTKEFYRIPIKEALNIQSRIKVTANAGLTVDATLALQPPILSKIVASLFKDISLALQADGTYEKTSLSSPKLYYKGRSGGLQTEFMQTLLVDVAIPLCLKASKARNFDLSRCSSNTFKKAADPADELKLSFDKYKVLKVTNCEKTEQGTWPLAIYKLYAETDGFVNPTTKGAHMNLFRKKGKDWKRDTSPNNWTTTIGDDRNATCKLTDPDSSCLSVRFGATSFDSTCTAINNGDSSFGLSNSKDSAIESL